MSTALSDRVEGRLRGLVDIAKGMDTNDPTQYANRVWILASVNDICDLVDSLRGKSDIVPLYDADLNPINRDSA